MPWFFLLLFGAVDAGFIFYALVSVENATRSAALYASASTANSTNDATACSTYVLPALAYLGNISSTSTCNTGSLSVNAANPVALQLTTLTATTTPADPDGTGKPAVQVTVWYLTPQLAPILFPGVYFPGQTTIKRMVTMRIQ
jgi:Flp pilus assembly protein TadG